MKYVIGLIAIMALIGGGVFFAQRNSSTAPGKAIATGEVETPSVEFSGVEHSIELTLDGYNPAEITIAKGDAIVFSVAESYGKLHWPASNLHPSHRMYPEFDPLQPIEPEQTWRFVFTKPGEWKFHDHLAPYFTGVITVVE